jgi:tetratricopeptide (TPR) repeat protein
MFSPKILLYILVAFVALGLVLLGFKWWILGSIVTVLGGVLLYLWWRLNQILQISDALVKNDIALARQKLAEVKNPDKLNAYSKTYYYFFQGMVEVQSNRFKEAKAGFKTSLDTNRFRTPDEKATALLMLAQLYLRERNLETAKRYIREAKALNPGDQIKEQINTLVRQARLRL